MEDILRELQSLHQKIDNLQEEITELKLHNRPTSSKDCTQALAAELGVNFETWLNEIVITPPQLENLFKISSSDCEKFDKNYMGILKTINMNDALKVFLQNKNTIYIFKNNKWFTMRKEHIVALQNKIHEKMRYCFRTLSTNDDPILKSENVKHFSYMEQRNKISQINAVSHTNFKKDLYEAVISYIV